MAYTACWQWSENKQNNITNNDWHRPVKACHCLLHPNLILNKNKFCRKWNCLKQNVNLSSSSDQIQFVKRMSFHFSLIVRRKDCFHIYFLHLIVACNRIKDKLLFLLWSSMKKKWHKIFSFSCVLFLLLLSLLLKHRRAEEQKINWAKYKNHEINIWLTVFKSNLNWKTYSSSHVFAKYFGCASIFRTLAIFECEFLECF